VNPRTIVLCEEKNPQDPNYAPLRENAERLQGSGFDVVPLPMPQPVLFNGQRLPASYANFYVCNAAVLVPVFADPNDRIALGIFSELFKDREVVGIPARDLVWGLGTLHCLSQQEPVSRA
jgi:agmatine deiminase